MWIGVVSYIFISTASVSKLSCFL
uniref:Uncharacterized protein n=1 Tax=Arundo donax TaxID=35708 RepID=A0A0A9A5R1_ARUDO